TFAAWLAIWSMTSAMKSPNIISTTGRSPVIAAPIPRPVKPASEIGVSITRSVPNSAESPERTLKTVPASATSSPMMNTRGSRRISSASASLIASAIVSSRGATDGSCRAVFISRVDILLDLVRIRVRRRYGELNRFINVRFDFSFYAVQNSGISIIFCDQPLPQQLDGIAFGHPLLLFFLAPVVFPIHIADVMAAISVRIAEKEGRAVASTRALDNIFRSGIHGSHILPVYTFGMNPKSLGPA